MENNIEKLKSKTRIVKVKEKSDFNFFINKILNKNRQVEITQLLKHKKC